MGRIRQARKRDLAYRFLAGALTSVVAGLLTVEVGPRVGGVMLAFPAILAASLTLIEQQEDDSEAREDARGAILGACAMALFAAICALTFGHWNSALVLAVAAASWLAGAVVAYAVLWLRSS